MEMFAVFKGTRKSYLRAKKKLGGKKKLILFRKFKFYNPYFSAA